MHPALWFMPPSVSLGGLILLCVTFGLEADERALEKISTQADATGKRTITNVSRGRPAPTLRRTRSVVFLETAAPSATSTTRTFAPKVSYLDLVLGILRYVRVHSGTHFLAGLFCRVGNYACGEEDNPRGRCYPKPQMCSYEMHEVW